MGRLISGTLEQLAAAYEGLLWRLGPRGDTTWGRALAARLAPYHEARAAGLAALHTAAMGLLDEADPRTTDAMLDAWERNMGLPDGCGPAPATDAERRTTLHARVIAAGGQSVAYFLSIVEAIAGHANSTIDEYASIYEWHVEDTGLGITHFRVGAARAGDRLQEYDDEASRLLCLLRRLRPAHTRVELRS